MRTRTLILMVMAGLLCARPATAAPGHRYHMLTPKLFRRLTAKKPVLAQRLSAVAHYRRASNQQGGTGFLVTGADSKGYALAITNHHVVYPKRTRRGLGGDTMVFHDADGVAHAAKVTGCVSSSQQIDYALVRVKLPKALRGLKPMRLATDPTPNSTAVYNAAYPRIWKKEAIRNRSRSKKPEMQRFVAVGKANRAAYRAALKARHPAKLIQTGTAFYEMKGARATHMEMNLPNQVGSSGSAVIRRRDHKVIGILSAGHDAGRPGNWSSWAVSIADVVRDIKQKRPRVRGRHLRKLVGELLDK